MRRTSWGLALWAALAGGALADEASDRVFVQAVGTTPLFSLWAEDRIVGVTQETPDGGDAFRVTALRAHGVSWTKEAERLLDEDDDPTHRAILDACSAVEVGGARYIYFSLDVTREGTAHAGSGELEFRLVDVNTLQPFTLAFWGTERGNGKIEGQFGGTDRLAPYPEVLAFLKGKAAQSTRIYRGERDSMSWADDWKKANASLPDPSAQASFGPAKIRWEYFDRNPMGDHVDSVLDTKENARFKVLSYFRSSLIGYDKAHRRYFPIWVESCTYGCDKEIRSLNGGVLAFVFPDWEDEPRKVISVDLDAGTVRMDAK